MRCRSPHCTGEQVAGRRFCAGHAAQLDRVAEELGRSPRRNGIVRTRQVEPEPAKPECRLKGCTRPPRGLGLSCYRHRSIPDDQDTAPQVRRGPNGECGYAEEGCRRPARLKRSVCPACASAGGYAGTCAVEDCVSAPTIGRYCGKHRSLAMPVKSAARP